MAAGRSKSRTPERGPDPPWFPPEVDASLASWFARQLDALEEQPLWPPSHTIEIYRLTWLRTFHQPIAVRLEISSDQGRILGKACSGAGGYEPGSLVDRTEQLLTAEVARGHASRLELTDPLPPTAQLVLDGSRWILESVRDGHYTFREVASPDEGQFLDGCLALIEASGLVVKGPVY